MKRSCGFTIIELLVVIAIMAILASLAIPSYLDFFEKGRLRGAAEMVYEQLMFAKTQAIKRSKPFSVTFSADGSSSWSFGIADNSTGCDPTGADCTISDYNNDGDTVDPDDNLPMVFSDVISKGVVMNATTFADHKTGFEPLRGTALEGSSGAGGVVLNSTNDKYEIQVSVSEAGSITLCSPKVKKVIGYPDC